MSCKCKNKEYHPCQNGGECKCGGKCKNDFLNMAGQYDEHQFNAVGDIDDFKEEGKNTGKLILYIIGGIVFLLIGMSIYKKI